MKEEYLKSCTAIGNILGCSSDMVYKSLKNIDMKWGEGLCCPFPSEKQRTLIFDIPTRYKDERHS